MAYPYLLVFGEREGLAWVLSEQRMAFPSHRHKEVRGLRRDDSLFLYTSRGCFHNPTKHRGRVMGMAVALSTPERLSEPVVIAGMSLELACEIRVTMLAPFGSGVELAPLVAQLKSFPNKRAWASKLRRPLVRLTDDDSDLLEQKLTPLVSPLADARDSYLEAARPHRR